MTKPLDEKPARLEPSETYILLYGLDENEKPRAARFSDKTNRELLAKAADAMALKLCEAATPVLADIATKLPAGRLYSNGRGFVPYVRRGLYTKLADAIGSSTNPPAAMPTSWDEIKVGHLVIANEGAGDGWWEAIVVQRDGDMLTLRWRDFPKQSQVVRHRAAVALVPPVVC